MPDDKGNETADEKMARLERENAEQKGRLEAYDKTLKTIAERETAPPVSATVAPNAGPDAYRAALKAKGYKDEDIDYNMGVLRDFLPALDDTRAIVQGMGTLADRSDFAAWRATDRAFKKLSDDEADAYEAEVVKERQAALSRGDYARSYKDCAAIIRARKAPTQDATEQEIERRVAERLRSGAAAGVTQHGTERGTQSAGPGTAAGGITVGEKRYTRDEFERLPRDEKIKALESLGAF